MIQLSVGVQIVGIPFMLEHEIQRSILQKFPDLWDTKCSVTGLANPMGFSCGFFIPEKELELGNLSFFFSFFGGVYFHIVSYWY